MSKLHRLRQLADNNKLFIAIGASILIAAVLVSISMVLYIRDDVSRLDVSRPAYEKVRESLIKEKDDTFSASGDINATEIDKFQKLLDSKKKSLKNIGKFSDSTLDDATLKINPVP